MSEVIWPLTSVWDFAMVMFDHNLIEIEKRFNWTAWIKHGHNFNDRFTGWGVIGDILEIQFILVGSIRCWCVGWWNDTKWHVRSKSKKCPPLRKMYFQSIHVFSVCIVLLITKCWDFPLHSQQGHATKSHPMQSFGHVRVVGDIFWLCQHFQHFACFKSLQICASNMCLNLVFNFHSAWPSSAYNFPCTMENLCHSLIQLMVHAPIYVYSMKFRMVRSWNSEICQLTPWLQNLRDNNFDCTKKIITQAIGERSVHHRCTRAWVIWDLRNGHIKEQAKNESYQIISALLYHGIWEGKCSLDVGMVACGGWRGRQWCTSMWNRRYSTNTWAKRSSSNEIDSEWRSLRNSQDCVAMTHMERVDHVKTSRWDSGNFFTNCASRHWT